MRWSRKVVVVNPSTTSSTGSPSGFCPSCRAPECLQSRKTTARRAKDGLSQRRSSSGAAAPHRAPTLALNQVAAC
eukprot:scaffold238205_cov52-Prasinocladus_malaysianus.AAC.2